MRIVVTGSDGYIGTVLVPMLREAGHEVIGLDTGLYSACTYGPPPASVPTIVKDVRDVVPDDLRGADAVLHLAAISNDPVGDLNPDCTHDLNLRGTLVVARAAKRAGVTRFVFSSSCSLYGAGGGGQLLDEHAEFHPVTPYGETKILAERGLHQLADDDFSPTYLRNATAYGMSPRLRGDLVVNNLTAFAVATGRVLMKSDGTPWRPLVHIEDISRAFLAVVEADRELVHDEAFNVGRTSENHQIVDVAGIVESVVEGSEVVLADRAGPDLRDYRVDCDAIARTLPSFQPTWTVQAGVEQLLEAYQRHGMTEQLLHSPTLSRIHHVRTLIDQGRLDELLRWREATPAAVAGAS